MLLSYNWTRNCPFTFVETMYVSKWYCFEITGSDSASRHEIYQHKYPVCVVIVFSSNATNKHCFHCSTKFTIISIHKHCCFNWLKYHDSKSKLLEWRFRLSIWNDVFQFEINLKFSDEIFVQMCRAINFQGN